jgi:hypothetical protein
MSPAISRARTILATSVLRALSRSSLTRFLATQFETAIEHHAQSEDGCSDDDDKKDDISREKGNGALMTLIVKAIKFWLAFRMLITVLALDLVPIQANLLECTVTLATAPCCPLTVFICHAFLIALYELSAFISNAAS